MGGNGVHIAAVQHGVLHAAVLGAQQFTKLRDAGVGAAEEDFLRLGGALHHHGLARKVGKRFNAAIGIDRHHLTADHIRPCPAVQLLPPIHGKAAPDAVDSTAFHKVCFLLPVNDFKPYRIPHAGKDLGGNVHINAGGRAVIVQVDKRRVVIAAHRKLGQRCRRLCFAASGQPGCRCRRAHL